MVKNIFLILLSITFSLVVVESLLRVFDLSPEPPAIKDEFDEPIGNPKHHEADFRGYRNKSVSKRYCAVFLGDSQVYGTGVSVRQIFSNVLTREFNVNSYNMGIPGWGPFNQILSVDEAIGINSKFLFSSLYFGNDFIDILRYSVSQNNKMDHSSLLIYVRNKYDPDKYSEKFSQENSFDNKKLDIKSLVNYVKKSKTLRYLNQVISIYYPSIGNWYKLKKLQGMFYLSEYADKKFGSIRNTGNFFVNQHNYFDIFQNSYRLSALSRSDEGILSAQKLTPYIFRDIDVKARSASLRHSVLLFPTKETVYYEYFRKQGAVLPLSYKRLIEHESDAKLFIISELKKNDIPYIDLLTPLRNAVNSKTQIYNLNDGHLSPKGHFVVANYLKKHLDDVRCDRD